MRNRSVGRLGSSLVGVLGCSLLAVAGLAQDGAFVDGEFVEGYVYVPDFMSPDEVKRHIDEGSDSIVIVDTAAGLIFEEEHIPGAVNFPWVHELSYPVGLPRDKTLVLYCACQDHEDSADMAEKLSHAGYLDVKVLEGGWFEWLDLGYPIEGLAAEVQ
jgi:rhodanese-related sulfurtransferase